MKFKRNHVDITAFIVMLILTILVIYIAIEVFEIFPKEIPPSEPFEYPKN